MKITPVILSGGSGTRLWPLSRDKYPKQYLPLTGDNTMLQETLLRLQGLKNLANPVVVCNKEHRFLVAEQLNQINIDNATILLEPVGRNTAPAIAAAALTVIKNNDNEDSLLLVLSADHTIDDIQALHDAIGVASKNAESGQLATFGVVPTDANTRYGYIRKGQQVGNAFKVNKFIEKPNQQTADIFLQTNDYLWNSGMFMFKATILLAELGHHSAEIVKAVTLSVENSEHDHDFIRLEERAFAASPSIAIDYALMEKSDNVVVIPLAAGWSDVGSWSSLQEAGKKDTHGNVITGDVIAQETTNSYINATSHLVTTIGLDNIIIMDTPDALFVADIGKSAQVKTIVEALQKEGRDEAHSHCKVYRPWGWYDSLETGKHFQVKRLHIKPGARLSLQMHYKRAEHWVVVSGIATAVNGNETLTLTEGESTYIPIGVRHSLENNTSSPLEIIEVQSGTYLGEDDIIRFEDIYGRTSDD
jgi:mannose-1-phosphate guanylyltransferase/mannose-6-phosphate isomerase